MEGSTGLDQGSEQRRLWSIRRRWNQTQFSVVHRSFWENQTIADAGFMVIAMPLLPLLPLELGLWGTDLGIPFLRAETFPLPGSWVLGTGLVTFLGNALLVHRLLARKTVDEESVRPWVRFLRWWLGGFPLLSFWWIALWRKIAALRCDWAFVPRNRQPRFSSGHHAAARLDGSFQDIGRGAVAWLRAIEPRYFWIGWVFVLSYLWLLVASIWLASPEPLVGTRRLATWGAVCAIHTLGLVATLQTVGRTILGWGPSHQAHRWSLIVAATWLLPLPFPMLAFFATTDVDPRGQRDKTLVYTAYLRRKNLNRVPHWARLLEQLHSYQQKNPWWRLRWPLAEGLEGMELTLQQQLLASFKRLKIFLLSLDACALGSLMVFYTRKQTTLEPWLGAVVKSTSWLSLALVALGLMMVVGEFASRFSTSQVLHKNLTRNRLGGSLIVTQLIFLGGLYLGLFLPQGMPKNLIDLLVMSLALAIVFAGFRMVSGGAPRIAGDPKRDIRALTLWSALLIVSMSFAAVMSVDEVIAQRLGAWLLTGTWSAPLVHVVLAAVFLKWLLLPFKPADLWNRSLSIGTRARLLLLTATAILPLGGLAVPLWPVLSRQLRLASERPTTGWPAGPAA